MRRLLLTLLVALLLAPAVARAADVVTEYPTPGTGPFGITTGPDGALWFTELAGPAVGRITTEGDVTEVPLSAVASAPADIVTGPDGALWAADRSAGVVHRVTVDGDASSVSLRTNAGSDGIASGPDGALWITQPSVNLLARVVPGTQTPTQLTVPTGGRPDDIVAGPDGAMWFTQPGTGTLGRVTVDGTFSVVALPGGGGSSPRGLVVGPDNALWVAEHDTGRVARVVPGGGPVREIALPAGAQPNGIASSGGVLWVTDDAAPVLWRVTVGGQVSRVALPAGGEVAIAVTNGPDGAPWFTQGPDRIGTIAAVAPPVAGQSVALAPVTGTIRVRQPGSNTFVPLTDVGANLPVGTEIDATKGTVQLTAAEGTGSTVAKTGDFFGGQFKISQPASATAPVTMKLSGPLASCRKTGKARAAKKKPSSRHLWGDAKGSFTTSGHVATATVRGTRWRVTDRCDGSTQVTVVRGIVAVRDLVRKRTVNVRAGHSIVIRPRK
jgi:virginiamycin B lyase